MTQYKLTALAAAISALLATDVLHAQEEAEDEEIGAHAAMEEVVVTGSRIKRRDFNSPSPIPTINREAIDASSEATPEKSDCEDRDRQTGNAQQN